MIEREASAESFLTAVGPLLYQREVDYGLVLGLCEGLIARPPAVAPLLLRLTSGGVLRAAALQTTPAMNLLVTEVTDDEAWEIVEWLRREGLSAPGVVGPRESAERVARCWAQHSGRAVRLGMDQKLYQLTDVVFPADMRGELVVAQTAELDLVVRWLVDFDGEALQGIGHYDEMYWRELAQRMLGQSSIYLWSEGGEFVSMAAASRPTRNGITINYVFTPRAFRRRGYASRIVAALSQRKLSEGKRFCALYTDATNPTSNKIYQDVGYREVGRSRHYIFDA